MDIDLKALVTKLDIDTRSALEAAAGLCLNRGHYNLEVEHWLVKLIELDNKVLAEIHREFDQEPSKWLLALNRVLDRLKTGNNRPPALAPSVVELIKNAWILASVSHTHAAVNAGHLIETILSDPHLRTQMTDAISDLRGIPLEPLHTLLDRITIHHDTAHSLMSQDDTNANPDSGTALERYTVNLTDAARHGKIDPVLGRDDEIRQMIDILVRRRQNNPILTGEAGVGKTAVVEGLALRIASGDVPDPLKNVSVRNLDLGLLQAGAGIKGEFENRLKSVISEIKSSPTPVILFIDEAHTLIGAGGKEGQGDAANLLKPALARGELRTIAATTWSEYKKYFERDPALTRRFQVVKVEEPDEYKAIDMLRGMAATLENHHGVRILDEAIVNAVQLSSRYMSGRQLPDKAISLLDTACARVSLSQSATPACIDNSRRHIERLTHNISALKREDATRDYRHTDLDALENALSEAQATFDSLNQQWDAERHLVDKIHNIQQRLEANHLHNNDKSQPMGQTEISGLRGELAQLMAQLSQLQSDNGMIHISVDRHAVAEILSMWTGIPVGRMVADEIDAILKLKEHLGRRVIGQGHALEAIAQSIQTSRAGLTDPRKPIGVFLMVGPSGVGKTETALALADMLYGGEQNLTVINMSEFKEAHKTSMLLGSPPGYVGYGEGGVLTEAVRRKPYSVILLDEMEKAHPGVQDVFYNLFDKGTIKDGEGRDIDFRNTIIIMTSNAAEEHIRAICATQEARLEMDVLLDNFRPQLLNHFKPAFLGRTTIIPYFPLSDQELMAICELTIGKIRNRVQQHYQAEFSYDENVILHIVARCQEVDTGARNIENIISRTLLPEIAAQCLSRLAQEKEIRHVHIGVGEEGEFTYQID